METVTISKKEYKNLKMATTIDVDLYKQLVASLEDIKTGKVVRVK